jgi:hypothetical protein
MSMIGNLRAVSDDVLHDLLASPPKIQDFLYSEDVESGEDHTDLDKAWHTIHFVLTGSAWEGDFPLGFLVSAGVPVGEEDVGYGPARAFRSDEVRAIHASLSAVSDAEFGRRFSVAAMKEADIYPSFGHASDEEERPYFLGYFQVLKAFVERAAEQNKALLVYVN